MRVRFLADADLNKAIVSGVLRREPSIDFLTAQAAGLRKMKDLEVLALAAGQQRVLVSHDFGTMPLHFRAFRSAGNSSAGVFLVAANPRHWDRDRRTAARLARLRSIGVGKPAAVVAALKTHQNRASLPTSIPFSSARIAPI